MVHDALRQMEGKGVSPDEAWTTDLMIASGSAFLGTLLSYLGDPVLMLVFVTSRITHRA